MKKYILGVAITLALSIPTISYANEVNNYNASLSDLNEKIIIYEEMKSDLHDIANSIRNNENLESIDFMINILKFHWNNFHIEQNKLKEIKSDQEQKINQNKEENITEATKEEKTTIVSGEYPNAEYVWNYLKNLGFNDYISAGILGNMMSECGGQSLNLQPTIVNNTGKYYGICQWSKTYYPEVWGRNLEGQMNFLASTIKEEIDTFGYLYKPNFNYNSFLNLTNIEEATTAFRVCYERGGANSNSIRQNNAKIAYEYFS